MARHLAAFYENFQIVAPHNINAVPDQQLFTSGKEIRVSPTVQNVCMVAATYLSSNNKAAFLTSPSLRVLAPYDINPFSITAPIAAPQGYTDRYDDPLKLLGNESLTLTIDAAAGAAHDAYGLVEFCDGPVKPASGDVFTVRATGAAVLSAGAWVSTQLALQTVLPAGSYNVLGFKAIGTNLVAARMNFVGQWNRPGVLGVADPTVEDQPRARNGYGGVYGAFDINQPPTVECLGITDTTQEFYLDLVKTK